MKIALQKIRNPSTLTHTQKAMNATKFLHTQLLRPPLTPSQPRYRRLPTTLYPIRSSKDGESAPQSPITPPDTVEIRFRRGARKRQKEQQSFSNEEPKQKAPPKSWEEMTLSEKALELYVGETGMLYWLNKFAYASIYIIIGGWILFRFVGPALDLYQLDAAPLAPKDLFKG